MIPKTNFIFIILLLIASTSEATRPGSTRPSAFDHQLKHSKGNNKNKGIGGGNNYDGGAGDFFGDGGGFSIPGFGNGFGSSIAGGGYGVGYGDPNGGYSKDGTIVPSVVCKERGPCYLKKVTCPARCFSSFSSAGKDYGAGGGGGGCNVDCKKNCIAYC